MNSLFHQFLSFRQIEYLALDRGLKILETSLGVQRFADVPQEVVPGRAVCLGFPELVGIEDILMEILEGRQLSFELKGIGRLSEQGNPIYIDIYIIRSQAQGNLRNQLIVFIENVTEKMLLEQKLVQSSNEVSLLLEAWDSSNEYLNKIIHSLAAILLVTTRSGIIKIANNAAQKLFEYRDNELLGRQISSIIIDGDLLLELGKKSLTSQEFLRRIEVVGVTQTGTQVRVSFSCSAIQLNRDNLPDFVYVGWEIQNSNF